MAEGSNRSAPKEARIPEPTTQGFEGRNERQRKSPRPLCVAFCLYLSLRLSGDCWSGLRTHTPCCSPDGGLACNDSEVYEEASHSVSLLAQLYGGEGVERLQSEEMLSLAHALQMHTEPRQQKLLLHLLKRLDLLPPSRAIIGLISVIEPDHNTSVVLALSLLLSVCLLLSPPVSVSLILDLEEDPWTTRTRVWLLFYILNQFTELLVRTKGANEETARDREGTDRKEQDSGASRCSLTHKHMHTLLHGKLPLLGLRGVLISSAVATPADWSPSQRDSSNNGLVAQPSCSMKEY
ncbi:unnamed protein product [Leuciscus chuanchicus]